MVQGGTKDETLRRGGRLAHEHSTRSWSGQRRLGAPFGPRREALGPAQRLGVAQRLCAPRPTLPAMRALACA